MECSVIMTQVIKIKRKVVENQEILMINQIMTSYIV